MKPIRLLLFPLIILLTIPVCPLQPSHAAPDPRQGIVRVKARTDTGFQEVELYRSSRALLIGVSDYTAGWPDLESVPRELNEVARAVEAQGFLVEKHLNPDSRQLQGLFEKFIDQFGYDRDTRLLFFFSGHGYTRMDGEKGYLVPADAPDPRKDEKGFLRKALPMNQILAWSRQMETKHALFLFDSCFSGTIFKAKDLPEAPAYVSTAVALQVRQFITAGSANEIVPARSVFTPAFVDALNYGWGDLNKDGYISGTELGLYLQAKVPQYSHQTPQYGKIQDYQLSRGDFIFVSGSEKPGGGLTVDTTPAGAQVTINGVPKGRSPVSETGLEPGQVIVRVELDGYEPAQKIVMVREGKQVPVMFPLTRYPNYGSLRVQSDPAGAEWYLDHAYAGITPDFMPKLEIGPHEVTIRATGFQEWRGQVAVALSEEAVVQARLVAERPSRGRLFVRTTPAGANIRILNTNQSFSQGLELNPGKYLVEVTAQGHDKMLSWAELAAGEDKTLDIRLAESVSSPEAGSNSRPPEKQDAESIEKNVKPEKTSIIPEETPTYASLDPEVVKTKVVKSDGRYEKYENGVIYDSKTGLEWYVGRNTRTSWSQAKAWVEDLNVEGGGWRMPAKSEINDIYEIGAGPRNISTLFETTGWLVWTGETMWHSFAFGLFMDSLDAATSTTHANPQLHSRAFAVRSKSDGG